MLAFPSVRNKYFASCAIRYLHWDDYFMAVAFLSAERSKDPSKQVRALVQQAGVSCSKHLVKTDFRALKQAWFDATRQCTKA